MLCKGYTYYKPQDARGKGFSLYRRAVKDTTLKKLLVRVDARRHHEDLFAARGVCDNV